MQPKFLPVENLDYKVSQDFYNVDKQLINISQKS